MHTLLQTCVGLASMLTCVLTVVSWTSITRNRSRITQVESFSWPPMSNLRNKRGDAFNYAGMSQFFTGLFSNDDDSAFLMPTSTDVTQVLGKHASDQVNLDDTLDVIAIRDTSLAVSRSCYLSSVDQGLEDNRMRIFDSMYTIMETCLPLSITSARAVHNGGRDDVELRLQSNKPSTATFVILRPLFVRIAGSSVYSVNILSSEALTSMISIASNTMIEYDSSNPSDVYVVLKRVKDPIVAPIVDEINDRYLTVGHSKRVVEDVTSVFFLRNDGVKLPMKKDDRNFGRVLTLYFTMPQTFDVSPKRIFEIQGGNTSIIVDLIRKGAVGGILNIQIVDDHKDSHISIDVEQGALVVVVLSNNLLLMCMMHSTRITYKSFVLSSVFHMNSFGGSDKIMSMIAKTSTYAPEGLTPYNNTSIPDLADISTRMRFYPTKIYK